MSKHTPGPWRLASQDQCYAHIEGDGLLDGKSGILARVLLTGDGFSNANARLIAAAPEFYDWAKANAPEMECRRDEDCDHCVLVQIIAKAEGRDARAED